MEEELRDGERRSRGLLRQQRLDVLAAVRRARMPVGEGGDGDVHVTTGRDAHRAGDAGHGRLLIGRAFGLHPVDQLHELRGALEVSEEGLALGPVRGRVAAKGEEAEDAGIQELPDEPCRVDVGVADAGEVRERLDVGGRADVPEHLERAPAGRSSCPVGDGEEIGSAAARCRMVSCRASSVAELRGGYSSKEKGTRVTGSSSHADIDRACQHARTGQEGADCYVVCRQRPG